MQNNVATDVKKTRLVCARQFFLGRVSLRMYILGVGRARGTIFGAARSVVCFLELLHPYIIRRQKNINLDIWLLLKIEMRCLRRKMRMKLFPLGYKNKRWEDRKSSGFRPTEVYHYHWKSRPKLPAKGSSLLLSLILSFGGVFSDSGTLCLLACSLARIERDDPLQKLFQLWHSRLSLFFFRRWTANFIPLLSVPPWKKVWKSERDDLVSNTLSLEEIRFCKRFLFLCVGRSWWGKNAKCKMEISMI